MFLLFSIFLRALILFPPTAVPRSSPEEGPTPKYPDGGHVLIEYSDQGIHTVFFNVPGGGTYTGVPAEGFVTEKVRLSATHCNETLRLTRETNHLSSYASISFYWGVSVYLQNGRRVGD